MSRRERRDERTGMSAPPTAAQQQHAPDPGLGAGRAQLALIAGTDFTVWLGAGAIFPYLPVFLKEQAHASLGLIGLIAAAYFVGVFAFSSWFGHLSDRVGRKPMIIFGTVLYAVATALFVTTTHPGWFVVFRLIEGMGAAAVVPARAGVRRRHHEQREPQPRLRLADVGAVRRPHHRTGHRLAPLRPRRRPGRLGLLHDLHIRRGAHGRGRRRAAALPARAGARARPA